MMYTTSMRGFTLVETLVAITVVVTAMVGPLYAVQQSLNASRTAHEQLIASSLAQEGVEYVRSVRDSNYLSNMSWLYGLDGTGDSVDCRTEACVVDPTQTLNPVSSTIGPLYLSSENLYNQAGSGVVTQYTRTVQLTPISISEMMVTVTVTWVSKGQQRNVVITEYLYNWL